MLSWILYRIGGRWVQNRMAYVRRSDWMFYFCGCAEGAIVALAFGIGIGLLF